MWQEKDGTPGNSGSFTHGQGATFDSCVVSGQDCEGRKPAFIIKHLLSARHSAKHLTNFSLDTHNLT